MEGCTVVVRTMKRYALYLILVVSTTFPAPSVGVPLLEGTPADTDVLGDAFVDAWLAFRRDLDALSGQNVHPEQYEEWFARMPEFLLRDAVRLATNHEVLLSAVERLAEIGGASNRALIAEVKRRYLGTPIERIFDMYLVRAGDEEVRAAVLEALNHRVFSRRLEGALVLAGAGVPKGIEFLKYASRQRRVGRDLAVLALGRFGSDPEERFIRAALKRAPDDTVLRTARGELLLKRHFPHHYRAFVAKHPLRHGLLQDGVCETWLTVIERAVSGGATTSEAMLAALKEIRRSPLPGRDPDLFTRQMATLVDFWREMTERIAAGPRYPAPRNFGRSMTLIRRTSKNRAEAESYVGPRVSAAISVLSVLGERLDYRRLAEPSPEFHVISPMGERAMDGSLATSWPVRKGSALVLEHPPNRYIDSVLFMVACPSGQKANIPRVEILGTDSRGGRWRKKMILKTPTRYFQRMPVERESSARFKVKVVGVTGGPLTCIAELRVIMQ